MVRLLPFGLVPHGPSLCQELKYFFLLINKSKLNWIYFIVKVEYK